MTTPLSRLVQVFTPQTMSASLRWIRQKMDKTVQSDEIKDTHL